jgi:hypothetical protein
VTALALPTDDEIRRYARGALAAADALATVPTPLDDVTEAVGLRSVQDLFALGEDAPPGIRDAVRRLRGKVAGALALTERTVYLDVGLTPGRRRFTHAHELGHQALPWHADAYLADDRHTLSPDTRDLLEQEANAFSAELLFGLDRFTEQADSNAPGIAGPLALGQQYATSGHAALRRYAERSRRALALLALGRFPVTAGGQAALKVIRSQCVESQAFRDRWGRLADLVPDRLPLAGNPAVQAAARLDRTTADSLTLTLADTRCGATTFQAEVLDNGRLRLVLLYQRKRLNGPRLRLAPAVR